MKSKEKVTPQDLSPDINVRTTLRDFTVHFAMQGYCQDFKLWVYAFSR